MAIPYFLAISVVSHLLLLWSVSSSVSEQNNIKISCPSSFSCKSLKPLRFPLSNSTENSSCGLFTITCDAKEAPDLQIQLGNGGIWHDIIGDISQQDDYTHFPKLRPSKHSISTLEEKPLKSPICHVFGNFSFSNSPSISYTLTPYTTFFKCNKSSSDDQHFKGFQNYTICEDDDYHLYYKNPADDQNSSAPAYLPPYCTQIQLPIEFDPSKLDLSQLDPHRVLELFTGNFSLEMHVSKDCMKCHERGGHCQTDNQEFHCTVKKGTTDKLTLILGTAAAGTVILVALLCIIWKLGLMESIDFWKKKTEDYQNVEAFLKTYGSLSPKRYSYSDIKKITNSFRNKLGQGGYGSVFKGKLENGCLVAVKVLKGVKGSGEEFINEVATISRTSHVNVVTLLGFCFEGHNRALIYEFMSNGSLEKFIYDGNSLIDRQLGWEALFRIAGGIARGLEYLHRGCNTRILHFDIKPHNILVDDDFCPKISDFGLAKICPPKDSIVSLLGARGTAGYIAPEVFSRHFGGVSHKSDVYSYGMMILEMVGGRKNIQVEVDHTSEIYFPHWIYNRLDLHEELGLHGIANDEAKESARKMIIVGLWCIQTNPLHRPSMNRVMEMLEGSIESLQIPPKPFLSSPPRSQVDSSTTPTSLLCDSC